MEPPPLTKNPLFFLDYDGTLAPIVDDPMRAFPHPDVPDLLDRLAEQHPLYIVTGRHLRDVAALLDRPHEAIGLHGIQRGRLGERAVNNIPEEAIRAIDGLRASVPAIDGIRVEEKGPMFAVHYRGAPKKEAVRHAIREWLVDTPDTLDPIWGKDVVELRPRGVSKGTAVREISARFPDRRPVYLGDDVTDEDAFRALGPGGITVKVGPGETVARFRLPDVDSVVRYLRAYLG